MSQGLTCQGGLKTFSSSVNHGLEAFWILWVNEVDKSCVYPAPSFYGIKTADNEVELHIVVVIFILNLPEITEGCQRVSICMSRSRTRQIRTESP